MKVSTDCLELFCNKKDMKSIHPGIMANLVSVKPILAPSPAGFETIHEGNHVMVK